MNFIHLKKHLYLMLLLTLLVIIAGCGGGGSSSKGKSPSLSVGPLQNDTITINGTDMDGVAAIHFTLGYPGVYPPSITPGALITGASMKASSETDGVTDISITRSTPFSGSGPVVELSFLDAGSPDMKITISSVIMLDVDGHVL